MTSIESRICALVLVVAGRPQLAFWKSGNVISWSEPGIILQHLFFLFLCSSCLESTHLRAFRPPFTLKVPLRLHAAAKSLFQAPWSLRAQSITANTKRMSHRHASAGGTTTTCAPARPNSHGHVKIRKFRIFIINCIFLTHERWRGTAFVSAEDRFRKFLRIRNFCIFYTPPHERWRGVSTRALKRSLKVPQFRKLRKRVGLDTV